MGNHGVIANYLINAGHPARKHGISLVGVLALVVLYGFVFHYGEIAIAYHKHRALALLAVCCLMPLLVDLSRSRLLVPANMRIMVEHISKATHSTHENAFVALLSVPVLLSIMILMAAGLMYEAYAILPLLIVPLSPLMVDVITTKSSKG